MNKLEAIIVDLDGTLCNNNHRKHFVEGKSKDWKTFYTLMNQDSVNEWCLDIIKKYNKDDYEILLVTGRPEEYRLKTEKWLWKFGINYKHLLMRESGDFRKDCIIKEEIYRKYIEHDYNILFCLDDRKQVVDMWRSIGLTCLQCAEGDF